MLDRKFMIIMWTILCGLTVFIPGTEYVRGTNFTELGIGWFLGVGVILIVFAAIDRWNTEKEEMK